MSDAAVKAKTGKDWQQWFLILDKADAIKMSHKEIAEYLYDRLRVPGWWSQMITVTYELERGLRKKHERPDGYSVSASRTFEVPISVLYKHWSDEKLRKQWLKDRFSVRKVRGNKSIRIAWNDNTNVEVNFYSKAASKTQVVVQHNKLHDSAQAEQIRTRWKIALERLSNAL